MQWIKYKVVCNVTDEVILIDKKIGYSEENLVIAEEEAYNGEYTIEDDGKDYPKVTKFPDNIDMNGFKITNLRDGYEDKDAVNVSMLNNGLNSKLSKAPKKLTNEDLNLLFDSLEFYEAYGDNVCQGIPEDVSGMSFGLFVFKKGYSGFGQLLFPRDISDVIFYRGTMIGKDGNPSYLTWNKFSSITELEESLAQINEKLDGIEEGANKTIVDSELSDTSTNPVQNKVVTEKINSANSTITSIYNRVKNQVSYLARTQTANTALLKIGTFTGDGSGGRAIITLNGKKGWNYKNDGGLKVLTLSSNIPSDANGICTGATFYDFGGSNDAGSEILDSVQDVQILLVRPQDYAVRKVDVYIKFNSAYQYNSFFVNADWASGTTWEVDVKAITTTDTDPTTNALSSFVVPKKQFASLEKVETKADIESGTCTLTAYSDTVFGNTTASETLLNWKTNTSKYYTTGSVNDDGTLTVTGIGNARIVNSYNLNATGSIGVEFNVSGTGAITIEMKNGGDIYTSGSISLTSSVQKIQITFVTADISDVSDLEINIYSSGGATLTIENLLKITNVSTQTLTGTYDLVGNQATMSVYIEGFQNGGEISIYPLPFASKIPKSGICGAFMSEPYSPIYYDIDSTTVSVYLDEAAQRSKQLTFIYMID